MGISICYNRTIIVATYRLFSFFSPYKTLIDKIIDGIITLEALLLPHIKDELAFRLSLRAALLIGETEEERHKFFKIAKEAYKHRSDLIHGEIKPIKIRREFPNDFYQLCMKVYLKCLDLYDSESYIDPKSYSKDYQALFRKIEFSQFNDTSLKLEDILDLKFTTYEEYREYLTSYL